MYGTYSDAYYEENKEGSEGEDGNDVLLRSESPHFACFSGTPIPQPKDLDGIFELFARNRCDFESHDGPKDGPMVTKAWQQAQKTWKKEMGTETTNESALLAIELVRAAFKLCFQARDRSALWFDGNKILDIPDPTQHEISVTYHSRVVSRLEASFMRVATKSINTYAKKSINWNGIFAKLHYTQTIPATLSLLDDATCADFVTKAEKLNADLDEPQTSRMRLGWDHVLTHTWYTEDGRCPILRCMSALIQGNPRVGLIMEVLQMVGQRKDETCW